MSETGTGLAKEAYRLSADLLTPNPFVYWTDLLATCVVLYVALAVELTAPGVAAPLLAGVVAALALYRALSFIHELTHLRPDDAPGFSVAWNLLVGVPFLAPSWFYEGVHNLHHTRQRFGTAGDPEYLPLARFSPLKLAGFLLMGAAIPFLMILRFGVLTPLSLLAPPLRRWTLRKVSSLAINPDFVRVDLDKGVSAGRLAVEIGCWLWVWGVAFAVTSGALSARQLMLALAAFSLATLINQARTLVAHYWENDGEPMTQEAQFLDSVNVPPPNLFAAVWAPVGLRYHALHHLLPRAPYHNLGLIHARLKAALPEGTRYGAVEERGLIVAMSALFRKLGAGGVAASPRLG